MSDSIICDDKTEVIVETSAEALVVETVVEQIIVEQSEPSTVEVVTQTAEITIETPQATVVEVTAGAPQAINDDQIMYSRRVDFINDYLLYRGDAVPGTAESASLWRVRRITIGADGDVTQEWAEGTDSFNKVWDSRLGYVYS